MKFLKSLHFHCVECGSRLLGCTESHVSLVRINLLLQSHSGRGHGLQGRIHGCKDDFGRQVTVCVCHGHKFLIHCKNLTDGSSVKFITHTNNCSYTRHCCYIIVECDYFQFRDIYLEI